MVRRTPIGGLVGTQEPNAQGSITGGPVYSGQNTYWEVDYDDETDGWSVETSLNRVTQESQTLSTQSYMQTPQLLPSR